MELAGTPGCPFPCGVARGNCNKVTKCSVCDANLVCVKEMAMPRHVGGLSLSPLFSSYL